MPDARGMVSIRQYWYGKTWTPERTDAQYPAITLKDKRNYNYHVSTNTKFNVAYARLKNFAVRLYDPADFDLEGRFAEGAGVFFRRGFI